MSYYYELLLCNSLHMRYIYKMIINNYYKYKTTLFNL